MSHIFLDESGDLGFNFKNPKTSKFFVITLLFVSNKTPIEREIKNTFKSFSPKERKYHRGTLHAYHENPRTRIKLLTGLSNKNISIVTLYLNKRKVYTRLHDTKHALYNYVTNIVLDRICTKKLIPKKEPIYLIASRRETNKFLNDNFKSYLKRQVESNHKLNIEIDICAPGAEKGLQAVDMICWAIFRSREHGDDSYRNLINEKIVEDSPLFP